MGKAKKRMEPGERCTRSPDRPVEVWAKRIGMSGPGPLRPVGTGKWRRGLGDGEGMRRNGFF